jgi:hypothetical protein
MAAFAGSLWQVEQRVSPLPALGCDGREATLETLDAVVERDCTAA